MIHNFNVDCLVLKQFIDVEENREKYYRCNVTPAIQYASLEIEITKIVYYCVFDTVKLFIYKISKF